MDKKTIIVLRLLPGLCVIPLLSTLCVSNAWAENAELITTRNDADGDLIVNTADIDDDNDGIPDVLELSVDGLDQDSDGDGTPDRLDLDSDNDGILDWLESGAIKTVGLSSLRLVGARLVGEVGINGMLDAFESPIDTGRLAYNLSNTDVNEDDIPDFLDLDSDNDGWPDLREAQVAERYDANRDGRIDALPGAVGNDGIADYLQQINDRACCDLDGDGSDDTSPVNTDMSDLPDYQDLDSDNDGLSDILELGGTDIDSNGHVDNFVDTEGEPDGMDDGLLAFPYTPRDLNGNGVSDHADYVATMTMTPTSELDPVAGQPVVQDLSEIPIADPVQGTVRTGLSASGCTASSAGTSVASVSLLFILTILSIVVLACRLVLRYKSSHHFEPVSN